MASVGDLSDLKQKIESKKSLKLRTEGKLETLMATLKKDYGCTTLQEGEKKLEEIQKKADSVETKLLEGIEEVKNEYPIPKSHAYSKDY